MHKLKLQLVAHLQPGYWIDKISPVYERFDLVTMNGVLLVIVVFHCQSGSGQPRLAEPMEIAALGRSFSLGALYDVRTEHLSPLKLWKQATLEKNKHVTPQPFTDFKYQAVNSFDQKTDFMDIEGSVKMSFISGLVEVEGEGGHQDDGEPEPLPLYARACVTREQF